MENLNDDYQNYDSIDKKLDLFLLTSDVKEHVERAKQRIKESQRLEVYKHRKNIIKKLLSMNEK